MCHLTHALSYSKKDLKGQKCSSIPSSPLLSQLCDIKQVSMGLSLLISASKGVTEAHTERHRRASTELSQECWGLHPSSCPKGQCHLGQVPSFLWAAVAVSPSGH